MKPVDTRRCEVHVLVCTNLRPAPQVSCQPVGGEKLYFRLKEAINAHGLQGTHWATRTACLGFCSASGATVSIRRKSREPRWFAEVSEADFDIIWNEIMRE